MAKSKSVIGTPTITQPLRSFVAICIRLHKDRDGKTEYSDPVILYYEDVDEEHALTSVRAYLKGMAFKSPWRIKLTETCATVEYDGVS